MVRIAAVFLLLALPPLAGAVSLADQLTPDTPYYFDNFDPGQRPWEPGQHLNFEEVFKNYQYYEIVFGRGNREITVNQYLRGSKAGSEIYRILPDGSLRKNEP